MLNGHGHDSPLRTPPQPPKSSQGDCHAEIHAERTLWWAHLRGLFMHKGDLGSTAMVSRWQAPTEHHPPLSPPLGLWHGLPVITLAGWWLASNPGPNNKHDLIIKSSCYLFSGKQWNDKGCSQRVLESRGWQAPSSSCPHTAPWNSPSLWRELACTSQPPASPAGWWESDCCTGW